MNEQATVETAMTRVLTTLFEEENLAQAREKLSRRFFHHLPVVDGEKLVGMLSRSDVLEHTVAGVDRTAAARTREARYLEQTFVRDVMRTEVVTVSPNQTIRDAARLMLHHQVGALPVTMPDGRLVGILTRSDLVRLVADLT